LDLFESMRMFARVAEAGSFSAVARELGITQPTVSKHIAWLEEHFGAQLLARSTTGPKLTEAGAALYERSKALLDQVEALESSLTSGTRAPTGMLRVAAPTAFGEAYLTPILLKLLDRFSSLRVDLALNDRWFDLVEEGIDVAIRFGPLPDSRLIARKLGVSPQLCLAAPDYLERYGEPQRPEDLAGHRCIINPLLSATSQWTFESARGPVAVRLEGSFRANNLGAIRRAVLSGNGIAVGPLWLYYDDLRAGRVRVVLQDVRPTPLDVNALYSPSPYQPAKVRELLALLGDEFANIPALAKTALSIDVAGATSR